MKNIKGKIYAIYFGITLAIFAFEVMALKSGIEIGHPLLVIGQAFFVFGILSVKQNTFGYFISLAGALMVVGQFDLINYNTLAGRYFLTWLFPLVFMALLFSEWNDKQRIIRKGAKKVKAKCTDRDEYGYPKFSYTLDKEKHEVSMNKSGHFDYRKNEQVEIFVSEKDAEKVYIPMPETQMWFIRVICIFLSIFSLIFTILIYFE